MEGTEGITRKRVSAWLEVKSTPGDLVAGLDRPGAAVATCAHPLLSAAGRRLGGATTTHASCRHEL